MGSPTLRIKEAAVTAEVPLPPRELPPLRHYIAAGILLTGLILWLFSGAFHREGVNSTAISETHNQPALPVPVLLPSHDAVTIQAIKLFSARVERDPEDCRSQNILASLYLERVRQTGLEDYLLSALEAARVSVATVAVERNLGGLAVLGRAEFSNHNFAIARERAMQWIGLQRGASEPYALLGDACLELGDYTNARQAFFQMEQLGGRGVETETRMARLDILDGDLDGAHNHFASALRRLLGDNNPTQETAAWCRWQLGETAFAHGDHKTAERYYNEALATAPDYFRALASLGRLRAAHDDLPGAITRYEEAIRIAPVPDYLAALGDLYLLSGREKEAVVRYKLVEQLAEHSRAVHGQPYNRQLALFYADHDMKAEVAYAMAKGEYEVRRDIYGADALAWTALKSGRLKEAVAATKEALRFGTRDSKLFYHAAMVARASGDEKMALDYFNRIIALSHRFDPLQAGVVRKILKL